MTLAAQSRRDRPSHLRRSEIEQDEGPACERFRFHSSHSAIPPRVVAPEARNVSSYATGYLTQKPNPFRCFSEHDCLQRPRFSWEYHAPFTPLASLFRERGCRGFGYFPILEHRLIGDTVPYPTPIREVVESIAFLRNRKHDGVTDRAFCPLDKGIEFHLDGRALG